MPQPATLIDLKGETYRRVGDYAVSTKFPELRYDLRSAEAATRIYRCNWMTHNPKDDPETLPAVYGNAVLFSRKVWF